MLNPDISERRASMHNPFYLNARKYFIYSTGEPAVVNVHNISNVREVCKEFSLFG